MSTTILECLVKAQNNLKSYFADIRDLGEEQLNNAITLLEKGYNLDTEVDPLLDKYGDVESVPENKKTAKQPVASSSQEWFAVDSYDNTEYFDTPEEAKEAAIAHLDDERIGAAGGWSEGVENIRWGQIRGKAVETVNRPTTDDDFYLLSSNPTIADYEVRDLGIVNKSAESERHSSPDLTIVAALRELSKTVISDDGAAIEEAADRIVEFHEKFAAVERLVMLYSAFESDELEPISILLNSFDKRKV